VRDSQKSKCYKWENAQVIRPDEKQIAFEKLQKIVDKVWEKEGLPNPPPQVVLLDPRNTTLWAEATRHEIRVTTEGLKKTVLMHEIAHSMLISNPRLAHHGPRWVGVYVDLLVRHCRMKRKDLETSLMESGVKFNYDGKLK